MGVETGNHNRNRADTSTLKRKSMALKEKATREELIAQLRYALKCIEYCRKAHPDTQARLSGGEGIPAEVFIRETLARA